MEEATYTVNLAQLTSYVEVTASTQRTTESADVIKQLTALRPLSDSRHVLDRLFGQQAGDRHSSMAYCQPITTCWLTAQRNVPAGRLFIPVKLITCRVNVDSVCMGGVAFTGAEVAQMTAACATITLCTHTQHTLYMLYAWLSTYMWTTIHSKTLIYYPVNFHTMRHMHLTYIDCDDTLQTCESLYES